MGAYSQRELGRRVVRSNGKEGKRRGRRRVGGERAKGSNGAIFAGLFKCGIPSNIIN
jgi:hypothetical protein